MKTTTLYFWMFVAFAFFSACSKEDKIPVSNNIALHFDNTFKNTTIVLGNADPFFFGIEICD